MSVVRAAALALLLVATTLSFLDPAAADPPPPPDLDGDVMLADTAHENWVSPNGFALYYQTLGINYHTMVRLVTAAGGDHMRDEIVDAVALLRAHTGANVWVGPDAGGRTQTQGEIVIAVGEADIPCRQPASACAEPAIRTVGYPKPWIHHANITVDHDMVDGPYTRTVIFHELGHAFGLGHYDANYAGARQVMYPAPESGVTTFRQGDINGLREVAKNGFGAGHYPPNIPPQVPPTPTVVADVESLRVSWPPSNGYGKTVTGYDVQVRRVSNSSTITRSTSSTSTVVTGLLPATSYQSRVRAKSSGGTSAWSPWSPTTTTLSRCIPSISDVASTHPFCGDIAWMVDAGISVGYPDGTFRPSEVVTRQAIASFLYRMAGSPPGGTSSGFSDVPSTHPFAREITWMTQNGIAGGFPDGTFRPGDPVTRQAAAAFLYRFEGSPPSGTVSGFSDVPSTHPFAREITWITQNGITNGFPDGTFRPGDPVTRQAAAAFLHRLSLL